MTGVSFVVRAPATTANLGPGFDCAGAALDLWNELHVAPADVTEPFVTVEGEGAGEVPHDETHLALRAFACVARLEPYRFRFVNRIPLERGLGSSAATVAAGMVAGLIAAGHEASFDEVLELALPFEGHADNLVPALEGGVCLTWSEGERRHSRRIATTLPVEAILLVPEARVNTEASRGRLPESVPHEQAAAAAAQAALLGAAIAAGDASLLAAAFHDCLHEPYRIDDAPLLKELRTGPLEGAVGVTLSGSGPSVVVWAEKHEAEAVAEELRRRFLHARVLPLGIADRGTHAVDENRPGRTSGAVTLGARA
jgi:homoserine kinase